MERSSLFLRRVLLVDATISAACGLLMLIDADFLADHLGLPGSLLREAGIILLPFAALVAYLATRQAILRPGVWAVIACNAVWVAGSVALLLSGLVAPTMLGHAFVIAQAVAVAVLAEAEYFGLRKAAAVAA
jgi:hypothetical protein